MLQNYAEALIIPGLQSFQTAVDSMAGSLSQFSQQKNTPNLKILRQKFAAAYTNFQRISPFEFGPSESENLRASLNTFPANTDQINVNISSGSYNLGTIDNIAAKGFPAVDYLLYGKNATDSVILALFVSDAKAANRISYLTACISEIKTKTQSVVNAWTGNYKSVFLGATGSQIGSSLGLMVNQLNYELDLLKNSKIGIPLGKKSLGVKFPEKCEAFYVNSISVALAKESLKTIENFYLGRSSSGANGLGLDDYLRHLGASHGSGSLDEAINSQFNQAKSKLELVPEPLSASVDNNSQAVDAAYMELVKLLVLLKTDLPSALGIVITYQDSDGD
jgi:hypothetical protein